MKKTWMNATGALVFPVWIFAGLACGSMPSLAEDAPFQMPAFSAKDMVPLVHGLNWVDLDGDGHKDLVMKSRVTVNGAHSFSLYTFHLYSRSRLDGSGVIDLTEPKIHWYAALFSEMSSGLGTAEINSFQGADCQTRDIRLVITGAKTKRKAYVIEASRELGESYANDAPVTFTLYRLDINSDIAENKYAFIKQGQVRAIKSYCSVINAFKDEFGLPNHDAALANYDHEPH